MHSTIMFINEIMLAVARHGRADFIVPVRVTARCFFIEIHRREVFTSLPSLAKLIINQHRQTFFVSYTCNIFVI